MDQERTIRADGWLYRYAYWFRPIESRPTMINRCPFFWRLALVTLLGMPLWWLIWAPLVSVIGFFFAARPKFFRSDDERTADCVVSYKHWLRIGDVTIYPGGVLIWLFLGLVLYAAILDAREIVFWGHSVLFWTAVALGSIVVALLVLAIFLAGKEELPRWEWYRMARDAWRERKKGICPSYRVI